MACRRLSLSTTFLLLSSLLLLLSCHVHVGEGILGFLEKRHVKITNEIGQGIPLTIHCQSKDDDLGVHVLDYEGTFSWSFRSNIIVLSTLFWCRMDWANVTVSFDVYHGVRDNERCNKKCWWRVTDVGAYFYSEVFKKYELMHRWGE